MDRQAGRRRNGRRGSDVQQALRAGSVGLARLAMIFVVLWVAFCCPGCSADAIPLVVWVIVAVAFGTVIAGVVFFLLDLRRTRHFDEFRQRQEKREQSMRAYKRMQWLYPHLPQLPSQRRVVRGAPLRRRNKEGGSDGR